MADTQMTTHELWIDGRQMILKLEKTSSTSVKLSWSLPSPVQVYAGAVVLLSENKFDSLERPDDGARYRASTDWNNPIDVVGNAKVVSAFYGYFGDDITQTSVEVFNVDPSKIYYASIHACSSVLQYYTPGIQSYPLESNRIDKASSTYAGSIPHSIQPPPNPVDGQVYYDPYQNEVLVWQDTVQSWTVASNGTVETGTAPSVDAGSLITVAGTLKFFDRKNWIVADSTNVRIKLGAAWINLQTVYVNTEYPSAPVNGDIALITTLGPAAAPNIFEAKAFTSGAWYNIHGNIIQVKDNAGAWIPIASGGVRNVVGDPIVPFVGKFFYDTSSKNLFVWTGSEWSKADTEDEGSPTSDKQDIGTDGTYDDRLRLMKILKHQLGYPNVCVELTDEQFNIAIDNALDTFRQRADNAYSHRFVLFTLNKGQQVYYLNDPRNKTNKIVTVMKAHRVNLYGINTFSELNGLYAQAFFNQFFNGPNIDYVSIHLMHQQSELAEMIFAAELSFYWDEASRELTFVNRIAKDERIVLDCAIERTEQELMSDRWCKQWLQAWAESECWDMLGQIRSKYGNLPGANGGITMNGSELVQRVETAQTELLRQIADYEVGNGGVGFGSTSFIMG